MKDQKITIKVDDKRVSGLVKNTSNCRVMMVVGHGAGAGMDHPFMEQLAADLAEFGVGSLRYNFPYMEEGRKSPNTPKLSQATVRAAVATAESLFPRLPLLAGGKSYGGRMTSLAQSETPLPGVKGLVFYGFPLHAPGRPGNKRAQHLQQIKIPMLFLQGTRDRLADLALMKSLCTSLGQETSLQIMEGADHGFNMLKSSELGTGEARKKLAEYTCRWYQKL